MTGQAAKSLLIESRAQWRRGLARHHARTEGRRLVTRMKTRSGPHVSDDNVVEEAAAHGWIDSKTRIERLLAAQRMLAAGLAKVEAATQDGSWSRLDAVEQLATPPDLAAARKRHAPAAQHTHALPRSVMCGVGESFVQAKKPETRAQRIGNVARPAWRNERANPWSNRT